MDDVVQWATILSPIIAVIIALWASQKSAKDTAKHIESVEKSTRLQVESVKELSRIQIETTLMQIDKELRDAKVRLSLASRRENEINRMTPFEIQMNMKSGFQRDLEKEKRGFSDEIDYQLNAINTLERFQKRLVDISKQLKDE